MAVSLILADAQARYRPALGQWLRGRAELRLLAELAEPALLPTWLPLLRPQVLLLGLAGPEVLRLAERLHLEWPGLRLLGLSDHDEPALLKAWRTAGGQGLLLRTDPPERLLSALSGETEAESPPSTDGARKPSRPKVARP
jgi:DNA-binding NarL/FixJ family response regulator